MIAAAWVVVAVGGAGCRRPARAPDADLLAADSSAAIAAALLPTTPSLQPARDASALPAVPLPAPETWCVRALPHADARGVDPRGHVFALAGWTLRDESATDPRAASVTLPHANPACSVRREHLAFGVDGAAELVAHGRIYLHPAGAPASAWTETPFCTDVGGEPWASRPLGPRGAVSGWTVVGRRFRESEGALLVTDDPAGVVGWNARRGFRSDTGAIVLEGDGSHLGLTAAGDVWFVDTAREVAGGLLAAMNAQFGSATRTASGTALARDTDATHREVVTGTTVREPFTRRSYVRPAGAVTRGVFVGHYDQLIALTDRGVEWSPGPSAPFVAVARAPDVAAPAPPLAVDASAPPRVAAPDLLASSALGWTPDGAAILVTSDWLATTNCSDSAHTIDDAGTSMRR